MPRFTSISLIQFRNYFAQHIDFTERIVAVTGTNGCGKTNLLDAVYYLCFTKSYFSKPDAQSVFTGEQGFRLEGKMNADNAFHSLVCVLRENGRKEFYADNELYKKFSMHIGKYPCVMIAPDDVQLITGASELRRNFIDTILCQLSPSYMHDIISYKKILEQRNSFLKATAERSTYDISLLDILDKQLVEKGGNIFSHREAFLKNFIPSVKKEYEALSGSDDKINIEFISQLQGYSFAALLQENRPRDLYLQRTGTGIHKDDLQISMRENDFKNMASQGQRKTLLFALKLAEYEVLKTNKGFAPVLLLDDLFEKLDEQRTKKLLMRVCAESKAQVFITDTHKERLSTALNAIEKKFQLIELTNEPK